MNIFKILASGNGTLKEPNISAFLKFLLDPNGSHKLGLELLVKFISIFDKEFATKLDDRYTVKFFLEENLTKKQSGNINSQKNICDIFIEICLDNEISYLIYIEIKIKNSLRRSSNQLVDQILDITKSRSDLDTPIHYVFLSPDGEQYQKYYQKIKDEVKGKITSTEMSWKKDVIGILRAEYENQEVVYLIKNFIDFINSNFFSEYIEVTPNKKNYVPYKIEHIEQFSFYTRLYCNRIVEQLSELGHDLPQVSQRKSSQVRFIFRRIQKLKGYSFRMDVDRNKIVCLLNVPDKKRSLLNREIGWKEENKSVFSKKLMPQKSIEEFDMVMNDILTIIGNP